MLAMSVSERFAVDDCVVPACLRSGIFTIGTLDHLDHNPSSTTASSLFHGTGISVFQLPTAHSLGEKRPPLILPLNGTGYALSEKYATVNPLSLTPPTCLCQTKEIEESCIGDEKRKEERWVEHSPAKLEEVSVSCEDTLTWAAYHASDLVEVDLPALTALLPLFYEKVSYKEDGISCQ